MTAKRPDRKAVDRPNRSDRRVSFSLVELVIVVVIGILSSLSPAQNAVRLSVREVLDYE